MINFTVTMPNKTQPYLKNIQQKMRMYPQDVYNYFKKTTPIKSGNARSNTTLNGSTIEANYQYAGVLDKGRHMTNRGMRGSNQAPHGMTQPTKQYAAKRLQQILGK